MFLGKTQRYLLAFAQLALISCGSRPESGTNQITPQYDDKTGKLRLLTYDSNGNGKVDTWSYMDGARVVRIEIDQDEDGRIDRWEYYDEHQKLAKVGFSRLNDGKQDAWSYPAADGSIDRIEISTRRDGKISRTEHYKNGTMTKAEEDTDGDGQTDRWETYEGGRLSVLALDTVHRGTPDRRLIYGADGSARLEVDRNGAGVFVAERPKE
jgi:hypothetical protein